MRILKSEVGVGMYVQVIGVGLMCRSRGIRIERIR